MFSSALGLLLIGLRFFSCLHAVTDFHDYYPDTRQGPETPKQALTQVDKETALKCMAAFGDSATPHLEAALRKDSPIDGWTTAEALARSSPARARNFFLELLPSDENGYAIYGLGFTGDHTMCPLLMNEATQGTHRKAAIIALGNLGDAQAVETLRTLLRAQDTYDGAPGGLSIGANASQALAKLGPEGCRVLIAAASSADLDLVGEHAIEALLDTGFQTAKESLFGVLKNAFFDSPKVLAARALAKLQDDRALPYLKELVRFPFILQAIGELDSPEGVRFLESLATDGASEHQSAAIHALGFSHRPEAPRILERLLAKGDESHSSFILTALGRVGDTRTVGILEALALRKGDFGKNVREALCGLREEGLAAIERTLPTLDKASVIETMSLLASTHDPRASKVVDPLRFSKEPSIAAAASEAFWMLSFDKLAGLAQK